LRKDQQSDIVEVGSELEMVARVFGEPKRLPEQVCDLSGTVAMTGTGGAGAVNLLGNLLHEN
jgi:hypothetical protein